MQDFLITTLYIITISDYTMHGQDICVNNHVVLYINQTYVYLNEFIVIE